MERHNIISVYRLCLDFPDVDSESLEHFGEHVMQYLPLSSLKIAFPPVSRRKFCFSAYSHGTSVHFKDMVLRRALCTGVVDVTLKNNSAQVKRMLCIRAFELFQAMHVFVDNLGRHRKDWRPSVCQVPPTHSMVSFPLTNLRSVLRAHITTSYTYVQYI